MFLIKGSAKLRVTFKISVTYLLADRVDLNGWVSDVNRQQKLHRYLLTRCVVFCWRISMLGFFTQKPLSKEVVLRSPKWSPVDLDYSVILLCMFIVSSLARAGPEIAQICLSLVLFVELPLHSYQLDLSHCSLPTQTSFWYKISSVNSGLCDFYPFGIIRSLKWNLILMKSVSCNWWILFHHLSIREPSRIMELSRLGEETAFQGEKCCKMRGFSKIRNKRWAGLGYHVRVFILSIGRRHGLCVIIVPWA